MGIDPLYFAHKSAYIDEGCSIGPGTKIWHFTHLMPGCTIGANCTIGQNVLVSTGVVLGDRVKVQNNVSLYTGVTCEAEVFVGPSVVFTNVLQPRSAIVRKHALVPTLIKRGASIGANATIICGITIGTFAMIGAGTVVTKSVLPYALVTGNPGIQTGWVSEYGHTLRFNRDNKASCKESGQLYQLSHGGVERIG